MKGDIFENVTFCKPPQTPGAATILGVGSPKLRRDAHMGPLLGRVGGLSVR